MTLHIQKFVLGPLENNTLLITEEETRHALVIDPALGSQAVAQEITHSGYTLDVLLCTHAHFDHIAGAVQLTGLEAPPVAVRIHPLDLPLWQNQGGAPEFGLTIETPETVQADLADGEVLHLGQDEIQVRFVPGHTPGHVLFYLPSLATALVGDVIFYEGVGRTDLAGGNGRTLLQSIREQVLTLPPETVLIPGHGPHTTVQHEREHNPFL